MVLSHFYGKKSAYKNRQEGRLTCFRAWQATQDSCWRARVMGGLDALSSAVAQAFARVSKDIGQVSEGTVAHDRAFLEGYKGVESYRLFRR
jgi:hypothetical protein